GPSSARPLRGLRASDAPLSPRSPRAGARGSASLLAALRALGACRARQSRARQAELGLGERGRDAYRTLTNGYRSPSARGVTPIPASSPRVSTTSTASGS